MVTCVVVVVRAVVCRAESQAVFGIESSSRDTKQSCRETQRDTQKEQESERGREGEREKDEERIERGKK